MEHKIMVFEKGSHLYEQLTGEPSLKSYYIVRTSSAKEAQAILSDHDVDIVMSDEKVFNISGMEFLAAVGKKYPETIRIIFADPQNIQLVTEQTKTGYIFRSFVKPCNVIDVALTVHCVLNRKHILKKVCAQAMNMIPQGSPGTRHSISGAI